MTSLLHTFCPILTQSILSLSLSSPAGDTTQRPVHWLQDRKPYSVCHKLSKHLFTSSDLESEGEGRWPQGKIEALQPREVCHWRLAGVRGTNCQRLLALCVCCGGPEASHPSTERWESLQNQKDTAKKRAFPTYTSARGGGGNTAQLMAASISHW